MSHWLGMCPPPLLRAGTWLGRSYACRHSLLEFAHVSVTLCLGDTVSTEAPITSGFYHLSAFFSAQIPEPWVERCNTDILEMFFLSLENQLWNRLPRDSPTCRGCSLVWGSQLGNAASCVEWLDTHALFHIRRPSTLQQSAAMRVWRLLLALLLAAFLPLTVMCTFFLSRPHLGLDDCSSEPTKVLGLVGDFLKEKLLISQVTSSPEEWQLSRLPGLIALGWLQSVCDAAWFN